MYNLSRKTIISNIKFKYKVIPNKYSKMFKLRLAVKVNGGLVSLDGHHINIM